MDRSGRACEFIFSLKVKDYYIKDYYTTYLWPLKKTPKNIVHSPWTFSLPFVHIYMYVCILYMNIFPLMLPSPSFPHPLPLQSVPFIYLESFNSTFTSYMHIHDFLYLFIIQEKQIGENILYLVKFICIYYKWPVDMK